MIERERERVWAKDGRHLHALSKQSKSSEYSVQVHLHVREQVEVWGD